MKIKNLSPLRPARLPLPKSQLKYELYENSVQDAADDARILGSLYRRLRGQPAQSFREDFCGTFKIACEWVKLNSRHQAMALDIDPEPLAHGLAAHYSKLSPPQKTRLHIKRQNVLSSTPPVDIIGALNFSYWTFKTPDLLINYFKHSAKSLKRDGLLLLDCVGGTEMVQEAEDRHSYGRGKNRFTYVWRHEKYNPVTNEGLFSISFELKSGRHFKRAFTYDWRVWTIREIRECLAKAGFKRSWVFFEQDGPDGDGNGQFRCQEKIKNSAVWIAMIAASKI